MSQNFNRKNRIRTSLSGKFKLVWTDHAEKRLAERFPTIDRLQYQTLTVDGQFIRVERKSRDNNVVLEVRQAQDYFFMVVENTKPNTLEVVTVTEDSGKMMSIIKDL